MSVRVLVVGKLSDHKLRSKLLPLVGLPGVSEVGLVRRWPLGLPGVRDFAPPALFRPFMPLAEAWRLFTVLRLSARGWRDAVVVAFFFIPHGVYAEWARRLFGVRTVQVTISQSDVDMALRRPFFRRAVREALAVGVRGERSAADLRGLGVAPDALFDPPNLLDPDDYAPAADAATADIDVLFVGNLVEVKRPDILLHAAALLRARGRRARVVLLGDGVWRGKVEALRDELGLRDMVELAGRRPAGEVPAWLRRARVFALTSDVEGLPMAMLEAMCCGVPPVVPDVGDVRTVARHGENALLVPPGRPEAFADALERLLADGALHARLRAGCLAERARFAREYSLGAARAAWARALRIPEAPGA